VAALTRREREVLHELAEDAGLLEVAASLHVSYVTVRNHVQHILSKLEVHSIQEAVAVYLLWSDPAAS
jgi:two-component system response regulator DesR